RYTGYHTSISWYCCSTRTAARLPWSSIGSPPWAILLLFLVPNERLLHGLAEGDARLVAQLACGLGDGKVQVHSQELQPGHRQHGGPGRPARPRPPFRETSQGVDHAERDRELGGRSNAHHDRDGFQEALLGHFLAVGQVVDLPDHLRVLDRQEDRVHQV